MPVMAPPPQQSPPPTNPNMMPPNVGSSEQDMAAPGMTPSSPAGQPPSGNDPNASPSGDQSNQQQSPQVQQLQQTLDSLPDEQKNMVAQYLTPETIKVLNIVSGPDVANYLSQYANPNKVLVPVPRDLAQKYLQQMQQGAGGQNQQQGQPQGAPQQAQGQPQAAPQQAQGAAPSMKPQAQSANVQMPSQQLPNGVTPAPMQGGVMAPRA